MARKKISEYKAKSIVFSEFEGIDYPGIQLKEENLKEQLEKVESDQKYVLKVDQGIKKRKKQGLLKLNVEKGDILELVKEFSGRGYSQFLLEPMYPHDDSQENYLSLERTRDGIQVIFSESGGINVEEAKENAVSFICFAEKLPSGYTYLKSVLEILINIFEQNYFSFLEINPLVIPDDHLQDAELDINQVAILDMAVEVDSVAEFFVDGWNSYDFTDRLKKEITEEVQFIRDLDNKSQASLKLEILNPDGKYWLLLSGGGASITLADEFSNLGFGDDIGNYGEYSGNPNQEETYLYTKNVFDLMLQSAGKEKALVIAGGVANFTDVRVTFRGIIQALKEYSDRLVDQKIRVFIRRGGPHQEEGLAEIEQCLQEIGLQKHVYGPELPLTDIVNLAVESED
jgi:succinyl-CoA synthetase beta subunit